MNGMRNILDGFGCISGWNVNREGLADKQGKEVSSRDCAGEYGTGSILFN